MSQEVIDRIASAKTTEERRTTAEELADKYVKSMGAAKAFRELKLAEKINAFSTDKKNPGAREGALLLIAALAESLEEAGEPYLVPLLPLVLDGYGDKQDTVRHAAEVAGQALMSIPTPHAVKVLLPHMLGALTVEKKWQTKTGALKLLGELAHSAKRQIDVSLPKIVPDVSACMWDSKPEVRQAAGDCLNEVCATVSNPDLHKFIPILVGCIQDPAKVPETVHQLASTTFVTTVEAPSLAIMSPILNRGLNERTPAVLRQTSVIIDNMCKLVEDPAHAEQFLPKLMPGLNRIIEIQADPELRNVATRAKNTLVRVGGGKEDVPEEDATVTQQRLKEAHDLALKHVRDSVKAVSSAAKVDDETVDYLASLCTAVDDAREYDELEWAKLGGYLESFMPADQTKKVTDKLCAIYKEIDSHRAHKKEDADVDEGEELCNCDFSLAYGGMILLNNTKLRLTRGQRYALCGPNGVGKSTLMRAIANGQLDGFPPRDVLKTVFVEHNLQGSDAEKNVLEFVTTDPEFDGTDKEEIRQTLLSVGFDEEKQALPVTALSGGWKMKLELARAMLMKADILLLDEPTNHLDVKNVAWLENYLTSLTNVTSMIVSHDSSFIDNTCTHVIHYESRKLKTYRGNLSEFVKQKPEAKAYYELKSETHTFRFPEPGFLEGVKSKDRAILKLLDISYQYPGASKPTITNISVQCSLNSRVACVGPNGAGKSTMIKVLTGETEPTTGEVYKHPNLRVAYVAQHAFHHVEQHLESTPNEYIRWRYQYGEDKELKSKVSRQLSEEDQKALETPIAVEGEKRKIDDIVGRRKLKKSYEYEIKWVGKTWEDNTWFPRDKLEDLGLEKFLQAFDDKEAAREGLYARPLTAAAVQKHLADVGLEPEFSTHSRIKGLSGGQKVKVVIGAAMWNNPHMLVLDEPTNYLDRDSLGALAGAIREYGGGVVIISHHNEFTQALCPEKWSVDAGRCTVTGGNVPTIQEKLVQKQEETQVDAMGNVTKVKVKRKLGRKELVAAKKKIMLKQKEGKELTESEDELCLENNW